MLILSIVAPEEEFDVTLVTYFKCVLQSLSSIVCTK